MWDRWEMFRKCSECGSLRNTVKCLRTQKPLCRSCCDVDCGHRFSCWGRYY